MDQQITLKNYDLKHGSHKDRDQGMCAMEFVAYLAREPHSDRPQCASPLITSFVTGCNDRWNVKERQLLKPYLTRIMGTRDGKDLERAKIFAMHAVTRISPHAIESIGLKDEAEKMRSATTLEEGISAAESAAKYAAEYAAKSAAESAAKSAAEYAEFAAKSAAEYAKYAAEFAAENAA